MRNAIKLILLPCCLLVACDAETELSRAQTGTSGQRPVSDLVLVTTDPKALNGVEVLFNNPHWGRIFDESLEMLVGQPAAPAYRINLRKLGWIFGFRPRGDFAYHRGQVDKNPVRLERGKRYRIRAQCRVHMRKDAPHFSVAWRLAAEGKFVPIEGEYLSPTSR